MTYEISSEFSNIFCDSNKFSIRCDKNNLLLVIDEI